jgi:hypothetical protein
MIASTVQVGATQSTQSTTQADVPSCWTCDASWYGDNFCDTNCGTNCPDIDCTGKTKVCQPPMRAVFLPFLSYLNIATTSTVAASTPSTVGSAQSTQSSTQAIVPSCWTCDASWYGDNFCDTNCGTNCPDIDCARKINPNFRHPSEFSLVSQVFLLSPPRFLLSTFHPIVSRLSYHGVLACRC